MPSAESADSCHVLDRIRQLHGTAPRKRLEAAERLRSGCAARKGGQRVVGAKKRTKLVTEKGGRAWKRPLWMVEKLEVVCLILWV